MILITGATGLVGGHLLMELLQRTPQKIRGLYRDSAKIERVKLLFTTHQIIDLFSYIEWFEADVTDVPALEKAFEGITYVYHCAGMISFNSIDEPLLRKINIQGTANIVNLSLDFQIKKLLYVSSVAALGALTEGKSIFTEDNEWNPEKLQSDYAITKYGGELEVWRGYQEGLPVVIVNPTIILGNGFWGQGSGDIFSQVVNGLRFYSEGCSGFVTIKDVVCLTRLLMEHPVVGERFIICGENLTYKTVLDAIADALQVTRPKIKSPYITTLWYAKLDGMISFLFSRKRKLDTFGVLSLYAKEYYDNTKVCQLLHYEFEPIMAGIEKIVALEQKSKKLN
ncbi:hypothetical protein B0A58_13840 [Flavobacterium branchiophilum NBRC 15030 = ATCC 35035]|uniref:Nucleoside-diphosphate-sugar epimerase n=1 Tax=Flavobacterium branchiophilum TaxID=55197 RepID=A0A543G4X8_9FLAO|nr:NAD-dependent epimerase/dehydratase family protein [Flavobacterium branchiophilum]OXA71276.1 hypothetical protein B0A58_13840 [Flavobacterium branchiophilum NBRC 15030 = ATCC 35035]TQM41141.1 nucleoside-diphosphate-sugar epimerase [Flavobacterium branchiophilum]GEM56545.1 NAD-dependent epimerase [Flavobacterium branchiophilum NBRC 15030 = ATCC 35035]